MTNPAWISMQIADLLRTAEDRLLDAITALGPEIHASIAEDTEITLGAEDAIRLKDAIAEAADAGAQLALLADQLPDDSVEIRHAHVRDGALTDLAEGIIDSRRALLAVGMLDVPRGWAALATALKSTDTATAWEAITLEQLLSRFRGADRRLARRAIAQAGLAPDLTFHDCSASGLARLAVVLHEHAARSAS